MEYRKAPKLSTSAFNKRYQNTPKWYPDGKVKYPKRAKPKKGVMLDPGQKKKATPMLYERARGGYTIPGRPDPKLNKRQQLKAQPAWAKTNVLVARGVKMYPKRSQARANMQGIANSGHQANKPLFGFTKKYPPSVTGPQIKGGRRTRNEVAPRDPNWIKTPRKK